MLKKIVISFLVVSLSTSCIPFVNGVNNLNGIKSTDKIFSIKSTTDQNEVKKNFLPITRLTKQKGKEKDDDKKEFKFNFTANLNDLKRNFILNITNGAGGLARVGNLEVKVNGTTIIFNHDEDLNDLYDIVKIKKKLCKDDDHDENSKSSAKNDGKDKKFSTKNSKITPDCSILVNNFFNKKTDALSVGLLNIKEGLNTIEVKIKDERNNFALDISIDGFLPSFKIKGSVHSKIPSFNTMKNIPYRKGIIGIKFLEGMKVRLNTTNTGDKKLIDLNGTNLTMLERELNNLGITSIYRSIGLDPDKMDQDEIDAEIKFKVDVPNRNLFYRLTFDKNIDIWSTVKELRKIPFLEEVYPVFEQELNSSNANLDPLQTEPELLGDIPNIDYLSPVVEVKDKNGNRIKKSEWLKKIHVAKNEVDNGAWSITRGKKEIRVAVIDTRTMVKEHYPELGDHEDFKNINGIRINFEPYLNTTYDDKDSHGTQTSSIIGSVPFNNKGVSGIAYESTIIPIDFDKKGTGTSLCKGTGNIGCSETADSMILARYNQASIINMSFGGTGGGITIDKSDPDVRAEVIASVTAGVSIVASAGNNWNPDSYQKYPESDISFMEIDDGDKTITIPNPDTGIIYAGGLSWELDELASIKVKGDLRPYYYNYGISPNNNLSGLVGYTYTDAYGEHGHGTDVSGPAFHIWTAHKPDDQNSRLYDEFGATSAVAPMVSATIALMKSVNPELDPLEIRQIIKDTRHDELITNIENKIYGRMPIAGSLDSYQAVYRALCQKDPVACKNIDNGTFQTQAIPTSAGDTAQTTDSNGKVAIKAGTKAAVPLPPSLSQQIKNNLSNYQAQIGSQKFNLLEVVQDYAIFKLDKSNFLDPDVIRELKNQASSILIRNKSTGGVELTLEQAIIILIEESEINVNFNKLLYYTNTGYLNLIDTSGVVENIYYGNIYNGIWNKTKTNIASYIIPYNGSAGLYIYSLDPIGGIPLVTNTTFLDVNSVVGNIFKWSPKGDKIGYIQQGIWVVDLNTKIKTKLTTNIYNNTLFNWSNDGNKIAFTSGETGTYEIYTMNSDGSNVFKVTNSPFSYNSNLHPVFTKDGSRILYACDTAGISRNNQEICSIKTDGTDSKKLTNISSTTPVLAQGTDYIFSVNDIKLSSDGTKIAFLVAGSTGQNLATMNVDGTDFRQITNLSGPHPISFTWATLENKLAYGTSMDGPRLYSDHSYIYTINADGTDNKLLKTEIGYGTPQWGIKSVESNMDSVIKSLSF